MATIASDGARGLSFREDGGYRSPLEPRQQSRAFVREVNALLCEDSKATNLDAMAKRCVRQAKLSSCLAGGRTRLASIRFERREGEGHIDDLDSRKWPRKHQPPPWMVGQSRNRKVAHRRGERATGQRLNPGKSFFSRGRRPSTCSKDKSIEAINRRSWQSAFKPTDENPRLQ